MMTSNQALGKLSATLLAQEYPSSYLSELIRFLGLSLGETRELSVVQQMSLADILTSLEAQVPVEYIVGEAVFCEHRFKVTPDVLIPRFDTEILVEKTISLIEELKTPVTLLDIGTGSGAIIISLAKALANFVNVSFVAIDLSPAALAIAKENAITNGVSEKISFQVTDAYPKDEKNQPLIPQTDTVVIVSNPPYISDAHLQKLPKSVLHYEPLLALKENKDMLGGIASYCESLEVRKKTIYLNLEYSSPEGNVEFHYLTPSTWKSALNSLLNRAS